MRRRDKINCPTYVDWLEHIRFCAAMWAFSSSPISPENIEHGHDWINAIRKYIPYIMENINMNDIIRIESLYLRNIDEVYIFKIFKLISFNIAYKRDFALNISKMNGAERVKMARQMAAQAERNAVKASKVAHHLVNKLMKLII